MLGIKRYVQYVITFKCMYDTYTSNNYKAVTVSEKEYLFK